MAHSRYLIKQLGRWGRWRRQTFWRPNENDAMRSALGSKLQTPRLDQSRYYYDYDGDTWCVHGHTLFFSFVPLLLLLRIYTITYIDIDEVFAIVVFIYIYIYTFLSFLSLLFPTPAVVTFFSSLLRWVFLLCCSRGSSTPILYGERDRKRWLRFVRADVIRWRQRRSTVRKCVLRYMLLLLLLRFGLEHNQFPLPSPHYFPAFLSKLVVMDFFSLSPRSYSRFREGFAGAFLTFSSDRSPVDWTKHFRKLDKTLFFYYLFFSSLH